MERTAMNLVDVYRLEKILTKKCDIRDPIAADSLVNGGKSIFSLDNISFPGLYSS
jgi:hypothetical protein